MQLVDIYEKETGKRAYTLMCHVMAASDEYVHYLESKVQELKKKVPSPAAVYRIKDPCDRYEIDPNKRPVYMDIESGKLYVHCDRCEDGACRREVGVV
jgi:hypothetical protein